MNKLEFINAAVESRKQNLTEASDKIWEFAEISLEEEKSCAVLSAYL